MFCLHTDMQEDGLLFQKDIDPNKLLTLAVLGKFDVYTSNIGDIEGSRPLVIDSWEAKAELLGPTLPEETQWK